MIHNCGFEWSWASLQSLQGEHAMSYLKNWALHQNFNNFYVAKIPLLACWPTFSNWSPPLTEISKIWLFDRPTNRPTDKNYRKPTLYPWDLPWQFQWDVYSPTVEGAKQSIVQVIKCLLCIFYYNITKPLYSPRKTVQISTHTVDHSTRCGIKRINTKLVSTVNTSVDTLNLVMVIIPWYACAVRDTVIALSVG